MTISAASTPPATGYGFIFLFPGLGLFGSVFALRKNRAGRNSILAMKAIGLVFLATSLSFLAVGCGGGRHDKHRNDTDISVGDFDGYRHIWFPHSVQQLDG